MWRGLNASKLTAVLVITATIAVTVLMPAAASAAMAMAATHPAAAVARTPAIADHATHVASPARSVREADSYAGCLRDETSSEPRFVRGPGMAFIEDPPSCAGRNGSAGEAVLAAGAGAAAVLLISLLVLLVIRHRPAPPGSSDSGPDDGWHDAPPPSPRPNLPGGGLPLPDAKPASIRLRGHGRIGDLSTHRRRTRVQEPAPRRPVHRDA